MRTPRLETERLILREVRKDDVETIFNCWMQDEEVSRYMWWKASDDIKEAEGFVEFELGNIDKDNWKRWIIEEKESGLVIGTCLVFINDEDEEDHWDISYNLGKKYWGKGYITEAMKLVMNWASENLGMKECITTYAKVNTASANVLHKLGFVDIKEVKYECSNGEIVTEGYMCRKVEP